MITAPLSTQLVTILDLLAGAGRRGSVLPITLGHGRGAQAFEQGAGARVAYVPGPVLEALASPPDVVTMPVCTVTPGSHPRPCDLTAVAVRFELAPEFDGREWRAPQQTIADVCTRLAAFPVRPAIVLDAELLIVAVWPLVAPLAIHIDGCWDRACAVQRALATRLEARLDPFVRPVPRANNGGPVETIEAWSPLAPLVPMPGSTVHPSTGAPALVTAALLEPTRRTTIEALEAALAPAPSTTSTPNRRAARATAKEIRP